MLLPPPTSFFPPPSPLPPSPLSGCVRCAGRSGGTATPAVIRDGPDGRTTKTRYGTASAVTEEEECNRCYGADPRHRLDDSLLRLVDGILLRLIVATMAGERGGEATARQRRGNSEAMARRRRGDGKASTRQRQGNKDAKAIGYGATCGRGNEAINKTITNNRYYKIIRP